MHELIKKYSQFINFPIYLCPLPRPSRNLLKRRKRARGNPSRTKRARSRMKLRRRRSRRLKRLTKPPGTGSCATSLSQSGRENKLRLKIRSTTRSTRLPKDKNGPITKTHFIAKDEVTFKSLMFVPSSQQSEEFNKYGSGKQANIKLYVQGLHHQRLQ